MQSYTLFYAVLAIMILAVSGHPNGLALQRRQEDKVQEPKQDRSVLMEDSKLGAAQSNTLYAKQLPLSADGSNTCGTRYFCPSDLQVPIPATRQVAPMCDAATNKCGCWNVCLDGTVPFDIDCSSSEDAKTVCVSTSF